MKNYLTLVLALLLTAGCTQEKIDPAQAKSVVEALINTIDKEDYKNISQYYTDNMNDGEPEAIRTEKLQKLRQMLGSVQSITFVASNDTSYNNLTALFLTYKIKHQKATSTQQFIVIKEKGDFKIARQSIESIN